MKPVTIRTAGPMPLVLKATKTGIEAVREVSQFQDELLGGFTWQQLETLLKARDAQPPS